MTPAEIDNFSLDLGHGSETALALILALIMFSVALGLRTEHFRFFKDQPRIYFSGVIAQIVGLPLLTVILCFILKPLPSIALGMILIACCPGGTTSNLLALYGRANTALSVSLTATSSLAAALITPISILFWSGFYPPTRHLLNEINLDASAFLIQTLYILAIPIFLGMLCAHLLPQLAARLQKPLAILAGLGLAVIIVGAILQYLPVFWAMGVAIFGYVLIHNGLAFLMGYISGVFAGGDIAERRALTFEVGIQNSGLAIVILVKFLEGLGGAGAIAGLWGTWHLIGGLTLVAIFRYSDWRRSKSRV